MGHQFGFFRAAGLVLLCWVLLNLCQEVGCDDGSGISVRFLKFPGAFSHRNTAVFVFEALSRGNVSKECAGCAFHCKLDDRNASDCGSRKAAYAGLKDGKHSLQVCANRTEGVVECAFYNWTVDTVPPTAAVTVPTSFTSALNVSVNVSFSEPCTSRGGFRCPSVGACNLLVYGPGEVIPSSLKALVPNLEYTLLVSVNSTVNYGRLILIMDKSFCADKAGNEFSRTENSSFYLHFDRRNVYVDVKTHIPEKMIQINSQTRTVLATNNGDHLRAYLYFSVPVLNSSAQILNSVTATQGVIVPTDGDTLGNRKFSFLVANTSNMAIITLTVESDVIVSRQETPVSPIAPLTFLYDTLRPAVRLSTTSNFRTTQHDIPIRIKFWKPVFGFNSSNVVVSGGHVQRFEELSRSVYYIEIKADNNVVTVSVPENTTSDVAGNQNLASNVLRVTHYSVPLVSSIVAMVSTSAFLVTSFFAGLLTVSTASLQAAGAFQKPSSVLTSCPSRNLIRIACHIQIFALSRWLGVTLPVEYYELARGLQWSVPYLSLPWEVGHVQQVMVDSNPASGSKTYMSGFFDTDDFKIRQASQAKSNKASQVYGLPLSPLEYETYFEIDNSRPEAEYIVDPQHMSGWRDFARSMFWLAIIVGSLELVHAVLLLMLKLKRRKAAMKESWEGALVLPRFEIFLLLLAIPCTCLASAAIIKGGTPSGIVVGVLLLGVMACKLLFLFLFLSIGITFGKLLQYKEVHRVGQQIHWYQELVRVTLGPGKRGQWTWKSQTNSACLTMFGPLFEDLRGPPKYMLSQISGGGIPRTGDRIIASDDETEDAEAPFIQKLFGILRIYYTLIECLKRVSIGLLAGTYMKNWNSSGPTIIVISITFFQLFFVVLKKPFIKKRVQLVEIISLSVQVCVFTCFVFLPKMPVSQKGETCIGITMIALFFIGFVALMVNEWYALYLQTQRLDPAGISSLAGVKVALVGVLVLALPRKLQGNLESEFPVNQPRRDADVVDVTSSSNPTRNLGSRSSGATPDKSWIRQIRAMARASFSRDGGGKGVSIGPNDPSSSQTKWSGLWGNKKSSSASGSSSADSRPKPKGLYKEMEDIFSSR
ncbi:hypothetical protein MLD38_026122 [Melastoma candidum]|uniref:Uncharacterized protein n=1 Tax=Melastoma candidum TaxID=119954 RepID=A0ACB9NYK8_9MYRT|nr:hypothetical protein MLD38_026122 [Melastoma candidum]